MRPPVSFSGASAWSPAEFADGLNDPVFSHDAAGTTLIRE
jgi:hypothetical protein